MIQLPIGLEDKLEGVVDLVEMKALTFDGDNGETDRARPRSRPTWPTQAAASAREEMLDALSMVYDELTEAMLEEKVTPELIRKCAPRRRRSRSSARRS